MLNVSDALKRIYRMNMLPKGTKADIQGKIVFGDLGLTVGNDRIVKDTFRLTEMISDGGDLDFGSTNASVVEFTVADVPEDLNGQRFTITQTVNGTYTVPLGTFTVDSCKRQDDLRFKDIVAYDDMQKFNRNVADWYNGLTFPITVNGMRESLCQYCGVAYEAVTLVNDSVKVYKTLDTNELNGKEVLRAIAEINGKFAHINRYAKLTFVGLDSFALYPSETLYPADDLYPIDVTEIVEKQGENAIAYISSKYEDYTVSAIDGVVVRDDENADGGVTVGESTNPYVMSGNMLIVGKETSELTTIAQNLLAKIGQVVYSPHDTESIGLPYVEVGDTVLNANSADKELFITKRVLTGLSSVMDNFSADGNPTRQNNNTVDSTEIRRLKGITTKIFKEIDRVGVEIENLETETKTQLMVMDGQIVAEINRAQNAETSLQLSINGIRSNVSNLENYTNSQIKQLSDNINLKVSKGNIIAEINLSSEEATIDANKINLTGNIIVAKVNEGSGWTIQGNPNYADASYICGNTNKRNNVVLKTGGGENGVAFACGLPDGYRPGDSTAGALLQLYHNGAIKASGRITCESYIDSELIIGRQIAVGTYGYVEYVATKSDIPTNTNQLYGDFREGTNGAYVALANSSGNHFLATTEWVINYVTSKLG